LTLARRQPRATVGAVGARAVHPLAQRRLGQVEIAGDGAHGLAFVQYHPDCLGLEFVVESPARPPTSWGVCHRCGHPIRLSESVHETGSSPRTPRTARRRMIASKSATRLTEVPGGCASRKSGSLAAHILRKA